MSNISFFGKKRNDNCGIDINQYKDGLIYIKYRGPVELIMIFRNKDKLHYMYSNKNGNILTFKIFNIIGNDLHLENQGSISSRDNTIFAISEMDKPFRIKSPSIFKYFTLFYIIAIENIFLHNMSFDCKSIENKTNEEILKYINFQTGEAKKIIDRTTMRQDIENIIKKEKKEI